MYFWCRLRSFDDVLLVEKREFEDVPLVEIMEF